MECKEGVIDVLTCSVPEVNERRRELGIDRFWRHGWCGEDIQPVPVPSRAAAPAAPTLDAPPFIRALANKS